MSFFRKFFFPKKQPIQIPWPSTYFIAVSALQRQNIIDAMPVEEMMRCSSPDGVAAEKILEEMGVDFHKVVGTRTLNAYPLTIFVEMRRDSEISPCEFM